MVIGIDASRANRNYKTGTEWYSYYLIKNLAEIDLKNKYILYTDKPLVGGLAEIVAKHQNFRVKLLKWPPQYFWTLGRLSLEMLKFWNRPKVLFVPAHAIPLIHPRRTITTVHDIAFTKEASVYDQPIIPSGGKFLRRAFLALLRHYLFLTSGKFDYKSTDYLNWSTKYALKHARKVITVSGFTKNEIISTYKTPAAKMVVIHNGYNNLLYKKITDEQKIKEVLGKYGVSQPFILCVGRLEKKKNIPMLIEALALLKERHPEIKTKLLLIGHAGYGYDEINYIIEEYNLNSEVMMLGWVEETDLPYIHNAASAFVFPSRHEGFGIPVIQALACGLPTAVSNLPVLEEVAGEAVLYFDKDNKDDIAEKLFQLLTNNNLRQELSSKGLERAKQFSWRKCAQETLVEIEKL